MYDVRRDPIDDYNDYELKQYKWLIKRPECCICGNHIQDEYGYVIEGSWYCEECMKSEFMTWIYD